MLQDGVVPRTLLPRVFKRIARDRREYNVRIVNVAHAGDGNVHPILLFDPRDSDLAERVKKASHEVLEECIACGGSITAEHGVGVEKLGAHGAAIRPGRPAGDAPRAAVFRSGRPDEPRQEAAGDGSGRSGMISPASADFRSPPSEPFRRRLFRPRTSSDEGDSPFFAETKIGTVPLETVPADVTPRGRRPRGLRASASGLPGRRRRLPR